MKDEKFFNDASNELKQCSVASILNISSSFSGVLFCMGNPLLDISAEVDKSLLDKFDLKVCL